MSALRRSRVPLAAFLAAGLGGLGIGLAVPEDDGDVREQTPRAGLAAAEGRSVPRIALPATPALRLAEDVPTPPPAVVQDAPQPVAPAPVQGGSPAPSPAPTPSPSGPQLEDDGVIIESPGG